MITLKKSVALLQFLSLALAMGALLALMSQTGQAAPVLAGQGGAEIAPEDESPYSYIKGFVRYADGTPIADVTLTAVDLFGGTDDVVAETDATGAYVLGPFADDSWFGTVTPSKTGFTFTPALMEYDTFVVDQVEQNYVGEGPPPTPDATPTPTLTPPITPTPSFDDSDGDGRGDLCETDDTDRLMAPGATITNILLPDSDLDGLKDGQEDPGDCTDQITPLALTNPRKRDTDGDGFNDGIEVLFLGSDPLDPDSPGDVIDADGDGVPASIDPDDTTADADGDKFSDAYELVAGSDPSDATSVPPLGDVNGDGVTQNIDAIMIFNYSLGNVPSAALTSFGNADVQVTSYVNNVDGIVLFNWTLGNVPVLPL